MINLINIQEIQAIVLRNNVNYGYEYRLTLGFKKANKLKYNLSFDGDGQHSIKDYKQ